MSRLLGSLLMAVLAVHVPARLTGQVLVSMVPNGGTFTTSPVSVTVKWCSNSAPLNASSRVITLNGVNITSQFSYVNDADGCTENKRSGGTITLQQGDNTLFASISDNLGNSDTHTATFTLSDKWPATLALAYADKFRDVGRCVADCFETVAQYSTPTYTSLDVARGATLIYRSERARPQGIIQVDATDSSPTAVEKYSLLLRRPSGTLVTFLNGSQELFFVGGSGVTRLAGPFDASGWATGAYDYTIVVRSHWSSPATTHEVTIPARVLINNGASNSFGAGWDLAGLQTITTTQPEGGTSGVMIASGDGSISFFAGCCTSFTSPPGDFSTLTKPGDTYIRRYPDGTEYHFSSAGLLTSITDRLGITTTIGRDGSNRVTGITDPIGKVTSFGYDGNGKIASITTPAASGPGRTSTFLVNANGALTNAWDPDGVRSFNTGYHTDHRMAWFTARNLHGWTYAYASDAGLATVTAPQIYAGGAYVNPVTTLSPPARAILARIADHGEGFSSNPIARTYDLRASVKNPRNHTTYFTLDRWGSPTKIHFANGDSSMASYHATTGQITQSIGPNTHTINYTWTGSNLTQVQDATISQTVNATYESTYNRLLTISGNTVSRTFTYPDLRTITMQAGSHPPDTLRLDYYGRDSSFMDGGGHQTKSFFSASGLRNTDSVEAPGVRRTRFRYDNFGRIVASVTPVGDRDSATYDLIDRQITAVDANNKTTTFNYDSLFLRKVTDALGQEYVFVRNALGWIEQETRPGSTALFAWYDRNGNADSTRNRRGQIVSFTYDALDRVT